MLNLATQTIYRLLDFAQARGLIYPIDRAFFLNRLLEIMQVSAPEEVELAPEPIPETAEAYLQTLADCAGRLGIIGKSAEVRDLFTAKIMGALTPSPAEVRETFAKLYGASPEAATNWFYGICRASDYIKVSRIAKNLRFFENSPAGRLEITINLSKPEKDPRDIMAARDISQTNYPKCMLCVENAGYAGRIGFPARQNHRMLPLRLDGENWHLQYSPYLYYDEHLIALNEKHVPMAMTERTFVKLFDFVAQFPHYFIGSNADLPIVGGSILNHEHFQGGRHRFPMDDAKDKIALTGVPGIEASLLDWPMTAIRLRGENRHLLTQTAARILEGWRGYSDPARGIFAETDHVPHNTITPILRVENGMWKLDLVLRNNRTSLEHPLGLFHPHDDLHHIKKENIGLIEVMGMFILPGRLMDEFTALRKYLTGETPLDEIPRQGAPLRKHYSWITRIAKDTGTALTGDAADAEIRKALAVKCARVLSDAGVIKDDAGALRFLETVGFTKK
jgi:UDPglucose--hexose-1-phosphate uridylyltransferase